MFSVNGDSMTTKLIRQCRIEDVPVYGILDVSSDSKDNLTVPQAFDFAQKAGGRLQTIGEALVVRVAFHNDVKEHPEIYDTAEKQAAALDGSNNYQRTRTVSLKVKNDGSFNVDAPYVTLFAELDNDKARALVQEGYDANSKGDNFLVKPVKDGFICDLIAQAKDTGRVAAALTESPLKLATAQKDGKSAYGQNQNIIAVFGSAELGEMNAGYLSERGYKEGSVWDHTTKELESEFKGEEDSAIVCSVGLGGGDYVISYANAVDVFNNYGRARGVVHVGAQKVKQFDTP